MYYTKIIYANGIHFNIILETIEFTVFKKTDMCLGQNSNHSAVRA